MRLHRTCWKLHRLLWVAWVLLAACQGEPAPSPDRLLAIVDAGSSGSRVYLYQAEPAPEMPLLRILMSERSASNPLAWYDGVNAPIADAGLQGIGPLLRSLDDYLAGQGIPRERVKVHVLGTAGVRLLDDERSGRIYESVARTITDMGYPAGRTETLSGQMEAAYAWISANDLLGGFHAGQQTLGIVEIGGASTQVAFETSDPSAPGTTTFRINGRDHALFSVSYLGLGMNEARGSMIAEPASGGTERNVCYPNSGDPSMTAYDAGFPGLSVRAATSAYAPGCASVYESVILKVGAGGGGVPSVMEVARMADLRRTRFVGVSAVFYAFSEWNVLDAADPVAALRDKVRRTCSGADAWPGVLAVYAGVASVYAQNACANATFILTYLFGERALGLSPSRFTAMQTIGDEQLTWTRGVALMEALAP